MNITQIAANSGSSKIGNDNHIRETSFAKSDIMVGDASYNTLFMTAMCAMQRVVRHSRSMMIPLYYTTLIIVLLQASYSTQQ